MKLLSKISRSTALVSLLVAQMSQGTFAQEIKFEKFGTDDDLSIDFPISASDATFLRENTKSDSVMLPSEGCSSVSFKGLMNSLMEKKFELRNKSKDKVDLFPPPAFPDDGFWEEFRHVAYVVGELKRFESGQLKEDPLKWVMPRITHLWKGKFNIIEVANLVKAEFPGVYHRQLITEWLKADSLKRKSSLFITNNPNVDFLRFQIMLSDLTGHTIRMVGPCDFALKWHVGRPRPEEIAYKIKKGELKPPGKFQNNKAFKQLAASNIPNAESFTAYEDVGSPNHPSYPAMHSAASAGSFYLDVTMDLTEEQLCEARMLDYSISYGRTIAGVHYESDNIAGLMLGQEILAQKLPQYLHDEYGADFDAVTDAVEAARFDWTTFLKSDCYTNVEKYPQFGEKGAEHDEL